MNLSGNKFWIGVVAIIIVIVVVIGVRGNDKNSVDAPIKIGFIGPLSGDAAIYGEPSRNGAVLAVDQINANGGINGKPVELIIEDGKCNGKDALNAAQKLVNVDNVKFIIGGACSSETMGFTSFAEQNKVLVFSYGSSNPAISQAGDYIFRNAPSDALGGSELAQLVTRKGFKKVAVITENTDFAQGVRGVFKTSFTEGSIVFDEVFASNTTDFRTIATKIKSLDADAIVINVQTGSSGARLAKQIREGGITAQLFSFFVTGDDFVKSGSAVEGTYILDVTEIADAGEGKKFKDAYLEKHKTLHSYLLFGAGAYDSVNIVSGGIKKFGYDADKVKKYLYDLPTYNGTIGTYGFDSNGDSVGIGYTTKQIRNQTLISAN
jgi:branched-chain amino acid transport system substrate-binding protein